MRTIHFHKMHGAGNNYIYVDARREEVEAPQVLSVNISDRNFGVGADGLVLIMDSDVADFRMRMFNADGSEAGMCGNASRCVGKYVYELGLTDKREIRLETGSGIKTLRLEVSEGKVKMVEVDMNTPLMGAKDIPILSSETMAVAVRAAGRELTLTCLSMGNPHAVIFVDMTDGYDVETVGRIIENHPLFPERCNVEFVEVISRDRIKMRVWERGAGETLACGTGACAALVAAVLNGKCDREVTVELPGGSLGVKWDAKTSNVFLCGGAEWICEGDFMIE